jgi:LPS-assembly protein
LILQTVASVESGSIGSAVTVRPASSVKPLLVRIIARLDSPVLRHTVSMSTRLRHLVRAGTAVLWLAAAPPASGQSTDEGTTSAGTPVARPAAAGSAARQLPIVVRGQRISGEVDGQTVIEGDADLSQGGLSVRADRLVYDAAADRATASGNVQVRRDGDRYSGRELQLQLGTLEGFFVEPTYFFSRVGAGGTASRLDFIGAQRLQATDATYSSCRADGPDGPAWQLRMTRMQLDFEANEGIAEGAVLRFMGVPILAAPVLSFPVTGERKSGWLPPSLSIDDKSGVGIAVPYYWNIAPDRDATLTPVFYSRRGLGLESEYRYLEPSFGGTLNLNVLPDDRVASRSRWAFGMNHEAAPKSTWDYQLHARRVSDDTYWKDFPRGVDTLMPRLLPLDARVRRGVDSTLGDLEIYGRVQGWQVLQDPDPPARIVAPYQRAPQLGVRTTVQAGSGLEIDLQGEINRFVLPTGESDPARNTGVRLHAQGSLAWPQRTPGWTFVPKLSVNAATYRTDRPLADGSDRVGRVIPTISVDSGWVFERDSVWFGREMRQTLEPRLLYVNTPYVDQAQIPNFDAAGKDFNFDSIFTPNAFSGVDRISDSHQLTAGVTTRLIDPGSGAERVRLGFGQRYLFREQRITPDGIPFTQRFSDILLFGSTTLVPRWTLDASLQYSPELGRTIRSILGARYSPGPFRTVSTTYRFARDTSEQLELAWQWPIAGPTPEPTRAAARATPLARAIDGATASCSGSWYSVGRVNYGMRERRITDALIGFEYDAGCWIGRVVAQRLSTGRTEATTGLMLQLELVGLSRLGTNPLQTLKDNIPGYRLLRDDEAASALGSDHD